MNFKKIFIIILCLNLMNSNSFSIEPEIFVQSTVNRASALLSKNISKIEKINELKIIAKETVDIEGIGLYTIGNYRKDMNDFLFSHIKQLDFHQTKKLFSVKFYPQTAIFECVR